MSLSTKPHEYCKKQIVQPKIMIRQFAVDINITDENKHYDHNYQAGFEENYDVADIDKRGEKTEYEIFMETSAAFNMSGAGCPSCQSYRTLKAHGSYTRWLVTWVGGKKYWRRMEVERTICDGCNKTHAILPDIAVPHMQHSLLFVLGVIYEYKHRNDTGKTVVGICAEREISTTTLYTWNARFGAHSGLYPGTIATDGDIAAIYWPVEGAVISGITKIYFTQQGFSLMQYNKAAAQSQGAGKRAASAGAVPHKTGIEMDQAIDYPVIASKKTEKPEVSYGKSEGPVPNGAVQVRADCANSTKNVPGYDSGSVLQEGIGAAVSPAGRDGTDVRAKDDSEMGGALHGRGVGRANQATAQGQRRYARTGYGRGVKDMHNQRTVPETAGDTS
jgi:hypothetical protein